MENILGKTENLELYNKEGKKIYEFCKTSNGYTFEYTYDSNGKILTYKDSNGYSYEYTRDANGKELTFKSSNGVSRGFDIPEYTMEELVEKIRKFYPYF